MSKLLLPAVLLIAVAYAIAVAPIPTLNQVTLTAFVLTLLVHAPAFMPVASHGKLLPSKSQVLNRYPEVIVPPMILLPWLIHGVSINASLGYWSVAVASLTSLVVGYLGVRVVRFLAERAQNQVCQSSTIKSASSSDISANVLFQLRALCAALSCSTLLWGMSGGDISLIFAFPPVLIAASAIIVVWSAHRLEIHSQRLAGATTNALLARQLSLKPTPLAVYHAGSTATQIQATKALCDTLSTAGLPFTLICREANAMTELRATKPTHLWFAPSLKSLSGCVQDAFQTILYANDTPKNSHFTRFSQYQHMLVTAFGDLARAEQLPKTLALYTRVIAASQSQAARWRANALGDIAQRVVTFDGTSLPDLAAASEVRPTFGLHLAPHWCPDQSHDASAMSQDDVMSLITSVQSEGRADLQLWLPPAAVTLTAPVLNGLYQQLVAHGAKTNVETPLNTQTPAAPSLTVHFGTEAESISSADILLSAQAEGIERLMSSGKPVLWVGRSDPPSMVSTCALTPDSISSALDSLAADKRNSTPQTQSDIGHFGATVEFYKRLSQPQSQEVAA
ncbi:hypothetical protein NBRC116594_38370 [Shimia sp. NS0008-38b]|uniref:hypothetical protein n=1 Tax=Shimia sp. NS0008-38b TaxID=3127653 RepID=UPI003105FD61